MVILGVFDGGRVSALCTEVYGYWYTATRVVSRHCYNIPTFVSYRKRTEKNLCVCELAQYAYLMYRFYYDLYCFFSLSTAFVNC